VKSNAVPVKAGVVQSLHGLSYGLDDRGSIPGRRQGMFYSPQHPYQLWVLPTLLDKWVLQAFFPTENRPGREADNSPHLASKLRIYGT